jgi:2-succinyl-6-hydroxy-2,4-cyclohexadiene-1-carboxylate synthase
MRCALLHGFAGDPTFWDGVVTAWHLPEPPVRITLTGHGRVEIVDDWDDNLELVAQQMSGCDVAVGYSLGARVALGLVASRRCNRGVLISVNPGVDETERAARRDRDAAWALMLREQGIVAFEQAWTAQPLFSTQSRAPAKMLDARRDRRTALDPEPLARSLETMGLAAMPDYRADMAAHASRIALIVGADDDKFSALVRASPAVSFEAIPDAGHDPTLETPEALAAAIARAVVALA